PCCAAWRAGAKWSVLTCILQLCDAWLAPEFSVPSSQFSVNPMSAPTFSLRTENRELRTALQIVIAVRRSRQHQVRSRSRNSVPVLVDLHTQAQTHRGKDLLDLVQRLAAKVFRLQHLGFGLLHQFADRLNVGVLQAVIAAYREFEFLDRTVQVLVLDLRPALFAGRRGFDLFLEIDKDIHVIFDQLRRESKRIARSDRTVGPDFNRQLVVIGDLSETRRFDGVVALAHRRVHGIDGNESDAEIVLEILVRGNVTAAALEAHFHIEFAALANGRYVDVLIEHLHIAVGFDHAAGNHSRLIGAQVNRFRTIARKFEWNLLHVEDDVGRVFDYARYRLEFMQHAFDLDCGNGRAFD